MQSCIKKRKTLKGFSIYTKKGTVENYIFSTSVKEFVSFEELKKIAYEITPILSRRKEDLRSYNFTLDNGSEINIGFREENSIWVIFLIAHIPASMKNIFFK